MHTTIEQKLDRATEDLRLIRYMLLLDRLKASNSSQSEKLLSITPRKNLINDNNAEEEDLNLITMEIQFIRKALQKHKGNRISAATDLGISERTLYRRIKEHNIKLEFYTPN